MKQAAELGWSHEELLCKHHLFIQPPKERQDVVQMPFSSQVSLSRSVNVSEALSQSMYAVYISISLQAVRQ